MTESLAELKTTQEEQADLVRRYVDEYAALALEADRIKQRMDWLKGQFETLATGALKDTKLLSISYWGSQNSRVTVTNTATVKPVSGNRRVCSRGASGSCSLPTMWVRT